MSAYVTMYMYIYIYMQLNSEVLNRMESKRRNSKVSSVPRFYLQEFGALVFAATMNIRQEGRAGSTLSPKQEHMPKPYGLLEGSAELFPSIFVTKVDEAATTTYISNPGM